MAKSKSTFRVEFSLLDPWVRWEPESFYRKNCVAGVFSTREKAEEAVISLLSRENIKETIIFEQKPEGKE